MNQPEGIVGGTAFGKIVSSFVADVIMPPIGVLVGGVDFSKLAYTLKDAVDTAPAVVISYGRFVQTVIDFTIIAGVIFIVVRGIASMKKKQQAAPATPAAPPAQEVLLREIRDLLRPLMNIYYDDAGSIGRRYARQDEAGSFGSS